MKAPNSILISPYCANDCRVCCFSGESTFNIQQFPEEAANKILSVFSGEYISITGKDPLQNLPFLRQADKHDGEKSIMFNPISFLTLEHGKPGKDITEEDCLKSLENLENNGLSEKASELVRLLSKYDKIAVSNGGLQAPNEITASWAQLYFEKAIKPSLSGKLEYNPMQEPLQVQCIGAYRKEGSPTKIRFIKEFSCASPHYKLSLLDNELRLHICCNVGMSNHISSYHTGITVEDIADSNPKELSREISYAHKKHKDTGLYNLLNPKSIFPGLSVNKTKKSFETLYIWTNDFLRENNKQQVTKVRTNGFYPTSCETCHTLALYLQRAGISPKDYQSYINDRFKAEMK